MTSGIGISFYFGVGDFPEASAPIAQPRPIRRRSPSPEPVCHHGSPDKSGGHWFFEGREFRRDADGRVWVKKQPPAQLDQPKAQAKPNPKAWKTPPSPPPAETNSSGSSSNGSSPKEKSIAKF